MAYQASFFRDGQWVTETVDLATALKGSSSSTKQPEPVIEHPACGILSSTVVDSPIVHKILPVRLRSRHHNDIALIGVSWSPISTHFVNWSASIALGRHGNHWSSSSRSKQFTAIVPFSMI